MIVSRLESNEEEEEVCEIGDEMVTMHVENNFAVQ